MRKTYIAFLVILLFFSTGCTNNNDAVYSDFMDKNIVSSEVFNTKEIEGTLTISLCADGGEVSYFADKFMEEHPNTKIECYRGLSPTNTDLDAYVTQMSTELMSGSGADIYEVIFLSYYKYSNSGLFEDLYTYMDNDPDFIKEDYFTNIFESYEINGQLNVLPRHISLNMIRLNKNIINELDFTVPDAMSYKDIKNIYDEALAKGVTDETTQIGKSTSIIGQSFDGFEDRVCIDTKNLTVNFTSDEYIKYLKDVKEMAMPWSNSSNYRVDELEFEGKENLLNYYVAASGAISDLNRQTDTATKAIQLTSSDGSYTFAPYGGLLTITKSSKNKNLAWAFLKYLIEEKEEIYEEKSSTADIQEWAFPPINKNNFLSFSKFYFGEDHEAIDSFKGLMEKQNSCLFSDYQLTKIIWEIKENYFERDLISAEECARQLQERTEIYLKE